MRLKRLIVAVVEYLLGFLALAVFAALAFGAGAPSDERFVFAFKVAASVALVELAVLWLRPKPANRLIVAANLWLLAGGIAALFQQWWWLRGYQQLGEASLFMTMLAVGAIATAVSPAGFVAATASRRRVVGCSLVLLAAVGAALAAALHFRGDVKYAAVLPVIALSWLNRALRRIAEQGAEPAARAGA